jgi:large subunit ribosomal protein L18
MSDKNIEKAKRLVRRKHAIRKLLTGTAERPRLSVYRSAKHIYAQVIDDLSGRTLAAASSVEDEVRGELKHGANLAAAKKVGTAIAGKAKAAGVNQVAFDRNGRMYHGRIKALADAARESGLKF